MPNKKPLPIDAPDDHIRPDLDKLVAKWQAILKLQDWDVTAKYARHHDSVLAGALGRCYPNIERNTASIRIIEPSDVSPELIGDNSAVANLVHEMLHVHFATFTPEADTLNYKMWERCIDMLSVILVTLDRATIK